MSTTQPAVPDGRANWQHWKQYQDPLRTEP
jgi:hypothetical protein